MKEIKTKLKSCLTYKKKTFELIRDGERSISLTRDDIQKIISLIDNQPTIVTTGGFVRVNH